MDSDRARAERAQAEALDELELYALEGDWTWHFPIGEIIVTVVAIAVVVAIGWQVVRAIGS